MTKLAKLLPVFFKLHDNNRVFLFRLCNLDFGFIRGTIVFENVIFVVIVVNLFSLFTINN